MSELVVGSLKGLAANAFKIEVAPGSKIVQPGMIVAVKDAIFTGTQSASVAASGNVAVTDLSITHEVADASNKLIISAFFGSAGNSNDFAQVGLGIFDGTSFIGAGASAGARASFTAGGRLTASGADNIATMPAATFVHTPGAGSKTYTVCAFNFSSETQTLFINRTEADTDNVFSPRTVSAFVIQEVAG